MRQEIQVKTTHFIPCDVLVRLGAEWIGDSENENIYLGNSDTEAIRRIRVVGETYHYSEKGKNTGKFARIKPVEERQITEAEAKAMIHAFGVIEKADVSSRNFRLKKCILSWDHVKGLGFFLEICATSGDDVDISENNVEARAASGEAEIDEVLSLLGISRNECISDSYFDLMTKSGIPKWRKCIIRAHKTIIDLTFGLTSGIMTTSGVLIGVYAATPSKLVVASSLLALAVSDSLSEAYAMNNAKLSEGLSRGAAIKYALFAMSGNVLVPLIFLIPLFLMPIRSAVCFNLILAGLSLLILNVANSIARQEPICKNAIQSLGLAGIILILATLAGNFISWIFIYFKLG